jgi:hypothetical protein
MQWTDAGPYALFLVFLMLCFSGYRLSQRHRKRTMALWETQIKLLESNDKAVVRQNEILERIASALEAKNQSRP